MDTLTNKIRENRFRHGEVTQKELAGRVGVSRQTINAIENGRHAPTVAVAIRIADVFGVAVDQLFELAYDGKPARHEQTAPVALNRAPVTAAESVETATVNSIATEYRREPVKEEPSPQFSLSGLRNVAG